MKRFVALLALVTLAQTLSIDDRTLDININVEKNSNHYHHGKLQEGSFEYGLDVIKQVDNHFQHKVKGPDGVTYGCYGFVDPDGKPHLVHYVSDLKGYRVVPPDHATKIYISRLEKSIDNIYQASSERNVQWKDLFFPPACRNLQTELTQKQPPTTPRPTLPPPPPPRPQTTPAPPPALEPEFSDSSNVHESRVLPQEPGCSRVCDELKGELQEIKAKLKNLIDSLAERDAHKRPSSASDGNGSYAFFPVMLSDRLPEGIDASKARFALPASGQCGRQ
ncbi:uncharacterized protein LOC129746885 isoform X2 [Uranotaenia lowii]|uniref:uncharacterized protein LOC129746885 isoform X2 n=1 Tax=Uranotaenia lowii TaxID=190385 RepID=UPI002478C046|nr:uncharacterized protein LOC129746885 isoform X2 [Uranotaenia lowii]